MHHPFNIKSRTATYPLKVMNMIRSRNNNKNSHHSNQSSMHDTIQTSSSTKYGFAICTLFTLFILYYLFHQTPSTSSSTSKSDIVTSPVSSSVSNTVSRSRRPFSLKSPSLNDLNPSERFHLDRLIKRYQNPRSALNPLNHLKISEPSDLPTAETKEINIIYSENLIIFVNIYSAKLSIRVYF